MATKGKGIMNNQSQAIVLKCVSMKNLDVKGNNDPRFASKLPTHPYIEKMLALNIVVCYHCMERIQNGERYMTKTKRDRISKYYHSSCFESMFY